MANGPQQEGLSFRAHMAKVRGRIRREIANAEDDEHEGGELNLVPYLDILINTIIFLLATTASALALANINVNSPRYEDPAVGATAAPDKVEDPKLNLTVAVSYKGFIIGGSGAVLPGPDGELPTIKCSVALKKDRCPAYMATRTNAEGQKESIWIDKYDYAALATKTADIKSKYRGERQVILSADRHIPYKVVVKAMDTLRGKGAKCVRFKCRKKDSSGKCISQDCVRDECALKSGCLFDQVILSAGVQ